MSKKTHGIAEPTGYRPFSLHRVALALIGVAVTIIILVLASLLLHQRVEGFLSNGFDLMFRLFDVGRKGNMPTWYNASCG